MARFSKMLVMRKTWMFIFLLVPGVGFSQTIDDSVARLPGPTAKDFHREYYYDAQVQAFHLTKDWVACLAWSPDSRRLLVTLHFMTVPATDYGTCRHIARKDLDYLNYGPADRAFAVLVIDADSKEISPVKLPFTMRPPASVSWWKDNEIVLVGTVTNGTLVAERDSARISLTRVSLLNSSYEPIPVPAAAGKMVEEDGGNVDLFQTVRVHTGLSLVFVSYWQCQAAGGGEKTVFFDLNGDRLGIDEQLNRNFLREAIQLPKGFATGKQYTDIPGNRVVATPRWIWKWQRAAVDEAFAPDGKLARIKIIPRPRTENGTEVIDMTGPDAFLYIGKGQKHAWGKAR
jgi:hypothetical protein